MMDKIKNKKNQGQIAIVVLLASAIILSLGLSASKNTAIETKIDIDEELLKEAFNTAESAINNYLNNTEKNYQNIGSGATIVSTSIGGGNVHNLSSEGKILANSNQLFWLVTHNNNGSIGETYYNGGDVTLKVDDNYSGALKIDYFYIDSSNEYRVSRKGCNYGSNSETFAGFADKLSCSSLELGLEKGNRPLLISITPLGVSTRLALMGNSEFPLQGEEIVSSSSTDNGIKTQIKARHVYQIPTFFIDAITARNTVE